MLTTQLRHLLLTEQQEVFIRKLKITLLAILGPFTLALSASAIADHFQIKNNQEHIQSIERNYVSEKIMLIYINELRETNKILKDDLNNNFYDTNERLDKVNDDLNDLIRELYKIKKQANNTAQK